MQMLRTYSNRWMILLLSLFIMSSARAGDGGGVVKAMSVLDGSLHQIKVDSSRTVEDSAFFNPAYVSNLDTSYSVQNIVTFKINEASTVYLHDTFTCNVRLRIYYTVGSGAQDSVDRGFTIRYDSAASYSARNSFVFYGARKVTVKVLSASTSVTGWDPFKAMMVENLIVTRPKFIFSCTNTVSSITITPVPDSADELPVSWTAILGADQYDLEWTYIDSSALRNGRYPDLSKVFLNNASRASVSGTSYRIPLMYDDTGVVFIRVRPVQLGAANSVTAAGWSSEATTPVIGSYTFIGHQPNMNWQSNISYAEEGKRKVVVQYFDGSLRSRQTVTKDNTTNTTIVAETYYDYQGRPAIQVMPSPTLNTVIQYTAGFNVSVNGAEYSQSNYDSLPGMGAICDIHADPMDTTTGASQYYSTNNPTRTLGMNQFIPNAQKYPFTETEYTPDNTGRISRQGGVGPDHQLGTGHETKYFYGTPDQNELDGLFGTEVGDHTHYFKNMVRDANGQYSVSYVDMHGRTIATALAGNTPPHLSALPSNVSSTVTENMLDSNSVATIQDLSIISQKSLLVAAADTFYFHYSLTPDLFSELNCQEHPVCYTCLYDLEITITDNCGNRLLGGSAYDTVINNLTISDSCSPSAMSVDFSKILPEGSYLITKKLTVDKDAYNTYLTKFYLPGNTCVTLTQSISKQDSIIAATSGQCEPDCATCRSNVGDWPTFWSNFRTHAGISDADTAAFRTEAMTAYQNALAACDVLCQDNESDASDLRKAMLQDVTPPFGQYADTAKRPSDDIYSIFYHPSNDGAYIPIFKQSTIVYNDANGNPDQVYNTESDIMVNPNTLNEAQFTQAFRPSWAESLLPYHPEYCKLLALEAQEANGLWDRRMQAVDDYRTAYAQGLLNPTANTSGNLPFKLFPFSPTNKDPLLTDGPGQPNRYLHDRMDEKIIKYQPAQGTNPNLGMWPLAVVMVKCPSNNNSACILKYKDGDTTDLCDADKDMAWRYFREMYQQYKHSLNFKYKIDQPSGCTPTDHRAYASAPSASAIYAAHHQPEFTDSYGGLGNSGMDGLTKITGTSQGNDAISAANDSLGKTYYQNVQAMESQWRQQLSACTLYSSVQLDTLVARLYRFCIAACDNDHPFGASTLPPGVSSPLGGGETSFQDIIKNFNTANGISDALHCNAEQITMPAPYDRQPAYALKPVYTRPSNCECTLITTMYTIYKATHSPLSFSAYLQKTQQITMSEDDLTSLRTLCANTTNSASCINLKHPILLPPAMQCYVGPTCASCETVRSVYRSYLHDYPADTPRVNINEDTTQAQMNKLFQNYMNSRLGFSKQTWEYLQFLDTCSAHSDTTSTNQCDSLKVGDIFRTTGTDNMLDMKRTADGGYIMVGSTTRAGAGIDAYIIRYDSANTIQWAKTYGGTDDDIFYRVKLTSDGGYIAVGATNSYNGGDTAKVLVVKLTANGITQWKKAFGFSSVGDKGFDIIQTSDGGYAIVGDHNLDMSNDQGLGGSAILAFRLDSNGNILWTRQMTAAANGNDGNKIRQIGTSLFVTGRTFDNPSSRFYGDLYQLSDSSGSQINEYHFRDSVGSISTSLQDLYPRGTGYRIFTVRTMGTSADSTHVAALDLSSSGSILTYKTVNVPAGTSANGGLNSGILIPTSDGGFFAGQSPQGLTNIYWTKADSAGNSLWSRQTTLPGTQYIGAIVQNTDSSYAALCSDQSIATLLRLSKTGTTGGCYDSTVSIGIRNQSIFSVSMTSTSGSLTVGRIDSVITETAISPVDSPINCVHGGTCYTVDNGPMLCGKAAPIFAPVNLPPITTCTDSTFFSVSKGTVLYNNYVDSLTGDFEHGYMLKCLQAYKHEVFTVTHHQREYHYTLYYYDQAGNLLKTVPPAGVDQHTDSVWLSEVRAARAAGGVKVPGHTLVTNYRYNSLGQIVTQRTPDAGTSYFWYDRLGRLALSQNARQVPNNQYSYTLYDSIGRITQVGQLVSGTAATDAIIRSESSLSSWMSAVASTRDQITSFVYDSANYLTIPALAPRNLRNRVAWKAMYNNYADFTATPSNHAIATYYSYDVLGNVDTLVQDYKIGSMANQLNRLKKIVYDYDLVSDKINKLSYQCGQTDAFYHNYLYDAENRITNVRSSMDSLNWDNDAFYSYYSHGPLARTVLGEQQVQGINYAYTIQGWLKGINPDIYTNGSFTLRPDSSNNVVGASVLNLLLNYYNGDYKPISGAAALDNGIYATLGIDSMPLFNGDISSMAVSVRKLDNPLLYNYRHDQLNRLIHMDAWKRTGSDWSVISKISDYQEDIGYDPNGNILKYRRNGTTAGGLDMDKIRYVYTPGTNRLDHIYDTVGTTAYDDIRSQDSLNYKYDSIGQVVYDASSNISNINWTVYGKIASVTKGGDTLILYTYDPEGNRISKSVIHNNDTLTTWYVRDAQGNVLSIYSYGDPTVHGKDLTQTELHIYGSSRLGIWRPNKDVYRPTSELSILMPLLGSGDSVAFIRGNKSFELTNHLSNVLATISDKKFGVTFDSISRYFLPDVISANDYYPFGMLQPGRNYTQMGLGYRYGFNGQEKSDEIKGSGNSYTADFWEYDPRIGRRLNTDPVYKNSPYESFAGNPIAFSDPLGLDTTTFTLHTKRFVGNRRNYPADKSNFSIDTKVASGSDVFIYKYETEDVDDRGNVSFNTKTTILHPEDEKSAAGVTKGLYLYFDGLFTSERNNYDWESVAKFMDIDKGFSDYLLKRHPESETWHDRASSIQVMEGLMPILVQIGVSEFIGFRLRNSTPPNISYPTKTGNYPSWPTVQKRYWQIMNKGVTPRGVALVRMRKTGQIVAEEVSMELHHINGRNIPDPHNYSNLKEVWPWEHEALDPSRHTGYDFIKWIDKPK